MKEQYHKWYSSRLDKEFEMLTFGYGGIPLLLFPTSKGSYHQYRDFGFIKSIENYVKNGDVKIYCPDNYDSESWYNKKIWLFRLFSAKE
jgi:esterase/lipase superfamily enzyme